VSLFEHIKDPELAERVIVEEANAVRDDAPALDPDAAFPTEVQRLRQRAREVDASAAVVCTSARPPLDALAQEFLRKCLEAGAAAAEAPQRGIPDLRDPDYQSILRACTVPLIVGDWAAVVCCRESAIAAVAELSFRRFAGPSHRFGRTGVEWTLSITFGF